MAVRGLISLTTGTGGSGKSYVRCARFLVDDFLPEGEGVHCSNFPIGVVPETHAFPPEYEGETFAERMATRVAERHKLPRSQVLDRIKQIPDDEIARWRDGSSGPWDYFHEKDVNGWHIAIDEIHNFCGRNTSREMKRKWQLWLGEIRHRGATIEFLSQHPAKIAKEIEHEAELRFRIYKREEEREPICGIRMGDWYEMRAAWLTGQYNSSVIQREERTEHGRWVKNEGKVWWFDPEYFKYYDSFSSPIQGGKAGTKRKQVFEKKGRMGTTWWFLWRNWFKLAWRSLVAAFLVMMISGNGDILFRVWTSAFMGMAKSSTTEQVEKTESAEVASVVADGQARTLPTVAALTVGNDKGGDIEKLRGRIEALNEQVKELRDANDELERELAEAAAIVLMTRESIMLRNGAEYRPGDRIDFGPYDGKTIIFVDWKRRRTGLDDGTVLRLGDR